MAWLHRHFPGASGELVSSLQQCKVRAPEHCGSWSDPGQTAGGACRSFPTEASPQSSWWILWPKDHLVLWRSGGQVGAGCRQGRLCWDSHGQVARPFMAAPGRGGAAGAAGLGHKPARGTGREGWAPRSAHERGLVPRCRRPTGHGQERWWRALETLPGPVSRVWGQKAAPRESKVSQRTGSEHMWGVLL